MESARYQALNRVPGRGVPGAEHVAALMQVAGMEKRYGDLIALCKIGFAIEHGEILGLIGPNGSGKSTLLECLAGLLPADAGTVHWNRVPLPPERRKRVLFYVPDGIAPYGEHPIRSLLSFFAAAYQLPANRVVDTIEAVALAPVLDVPVGALSKGYRRRVLMALGLLTPHPLLVMDEPFDGFDLRQTRAMMGLLRSLRERGRTLLLAIHQLADAEQICDRFVLLAGGRVRGSGSLDALRAAAGLPARARLEEVFLALT